MKIKLSKEQLQFVREVVKAGYSMIYLPDGVMPSKFEIDVVYVTREQKERR